MKRLLLLLLIASLFSICTFGQTNVRDSLQTLLDQAPDDTTKINLLVELSHVVPFPERSVHLNQALTLAERGNYPIKKAAVYNKLGEWQFMTRQFEQAVITFQTSADIFGSQDRYEAQSNMLYNASSSAVEIPDIDLALQLMRRSLHIRDSLGLTGHIIEALNRMAQYHIRTGDVRQAQPYIQRSDSLLHQSGDTLNLAEFYAEMVIFYGEQRLFDSAQVNANNAIALFERAQDTISLLNNLINFGITFTLQGRGEEAIPWYDRALSLATIVGNQKARAQALNGLGVIWNQLEEPNQALPYLEEAQEISERLNDMSGMASIAHARGTSMELLHPDSLEAALTWYFLADSLGQIIRNAGVVIRANSSIGQVLVKQRNYDQARQHLQLALQINEQVNYQRNTVHIKKALATAHLRTGQPDLALSLLQEAAQFAQETGELYTTESIYSLLGETYAQLGEYDNAYAALDTASMYKDSVFDETRTDLIAEWSTRYQTEKKEREIAEQQLTLARQRNYVLLALIGIGVISVLTIFFWRRSQRHKRLVQQSKVEIKELKASHEETMEQLEETIQRYQSLSQESSQMRQQFEDTKVEYKRLEDTKEKYERLKAAKDILDTKVPLPNGIEYQVRDIFYFKSDGNYIRFFTTDHDGGPNAMKIGKLEAYQEDYYNFLPFLRIHRSYLIQIGNIRGIDKKNHEVVMSNGQNLPVARGRREQVYQILETKLKDFEGM